MSAQLSSFDCQPYSIPSLGNYGKRSDRHWTGVSSNQAAQKRFVGNIAGRTTAGS